MSRGLSAASLGLESCVSPTDSLDRFHQCPRVLQHRLWLGEWVASSYGLSTSPALYVPHSKHSSAWCSKPGTGIVPSCTTCAT